MSNKDLEVCHVRLSKELLKRLDHWAVEEDIFRREAVERLLTQALDALHYQYQKKD